MHGGAAGTSKRGNSSVCSGSKGSPTRGVWPLGSQPTARSDGPVLPAVDRRFSCQQRERGSAPPVSLPPGRSWRCQVRSVVRMRMRRAMAAAPWLCQGRSQSSPRVPRPCHRATGRGPCPPPLPGGLSWSSRAGCRRRGAERHKTQRVSSLPGATLLPALPGQLSRWDLINKDAGDGINHLPGPCPPQPTQEPWDCLSCS